MSFLPDLPNEIFTQILAFLSFDDQKICMTISCAWYYRFQPLILSCIFLKTRNQFRHLFSKLQHSHNTHPYSFGLLIRRLTLGPLVGMSNSEFNQLPIYCPFLEYFDFDSRLWKHLKYTNSLMNWNYLVRFPCMDRIQMTVPILRDTGKHMTQLELSPMIVDELLSTQYTIFSILTYTPNLLSLVLSNGNTVSQNISISEFESIHTLCPRLEELQLKSFDAHLLSKDGYLVDIDTLPIANTLKTLSLDMSINSEEFLNYWAHKYPLIESINIQLRLLEPEYFQETTISESSHMKGAFAVMATQFKKLKKMVARFDEKYFPCDVFLHGINSIGMQLEKVSIHFYNFDYHRRSARNFKILISNSVNTITSISISNWDRSWDFEEDVLEPIGECLFLQSLSLSPQPGMLTEFDIDVILDHCTQLKRLELSNIYNLFVRDDNNESMVRLHRLEEFSLNYTMVNNQLFEYLAVRCPYLNKLNIFNIIKPYDNNIQVKINMPHHMFKSIRITGLHLGLRIEDSGFQCNSSATICSLEEVGKFKRKGSEKWYHLYQPKSKYKHIENVPDNTKTIKPRLQKLNEDQVQKIKQIELTKQLWEHISFTGARLKYEAKDKWELDIPYGSFSVRCRSVNEFEFEGVAL